MIQLTNTGFETWCFWQLIMWAPVLLATLSHLRPVPTSTQTKAFNRTSKVAFLHSCQGFHHPWLITLTQIFFPSPGDVNITGNSLEVPVTGRHGLHGFVAVEEQLGRQELSKFILVEPQDSEALVAGNTFVLRYTDWTLFTQHNFHHRTLFLRFTRSHSVNRKIGVHSQSGTVGILCIISFHSLIFISLIVSPYIHKIVLDIF